MDDEKDEGGYTSMVISKHNRDILNKFILRSKTWDTVSIGFAKDGETESLEDMLDHPERAVMYIKSKYLRVRTIAKHIINGTNIYE